MGPIQFDTVKTRMQTFYYPSIAHCFRHTYATEGIKGFFRGITPPLFTVSFTKSLSFSVYVRTKEYLTQRQLLSANSIGGLAAMSFLSGFASGTATSFLTQPLELIKVLRQLQDLIDRERAQKRQRLCGNSGSSSQVTATTTNKNDIVKKHTTMLSVGGDIVRKRGMRGLYHGFGSHYLRESVGSGVYFTSYELSKRIIQATTGQTPGVVTYVVSGALCGTLAWIVIFPLDVVKSSIQKETMSSKRRYKGFWDCVVQIYYHDPNRLRSPVDASMAINMESVNSTTNTSDNGIRKGSLKPFFRGISATMLRAAPIHSLNWVVYEAVLKLCIKRENDLT